MLVTDEVITIEVATSAKETTDSNTAWRQKYLNDFDGWLSSHKSSASITATLSLISLVSIVVASRML